MHLRGLALDGSFAFDERSNDLVQYMGDVIMSS